MQSMGFLLETNIHLCSDALIATMIVGVFLFIPTDVPKCLLSTTASLSLVSNVLHPQLHSQQTISFTHVWKMYVTAFKRLLYSDRLKVLKSATSHGTRDDGSQSLTSFP